MVEMNAATVSALVLMCAMALGCAAQPGATPSHDPAPLARVRQAQDLGGEINRVTWGVNSSTVRLAGEGGLRTYLSNQLKPDAGLLPTSAQAQIDQMTISRMSLETLAQSMEQRRKAADAVAGEDEKKIARQEYQQELNRVAREAAARHILRALYSPSQVLEQMTWFWLNHFSVYQGKGLLRMTIGDYEERAIRAHALGRFRDLLGAVAHHPAMLQYLDNEQNAAGHLNENYARELMELHTLGVNAGYTQSDVQELARILTGVGVNFSPTTPGLRTEFKRFYVRDGLFEFNPNRHDFGAKVFLGRPIKSAGLAELDEALDRLVRHPATAHFVSRKLAHYWMSDDPPARVVDAMARTFSQTDGDIARVLQTLFSTPEFAASRKFKDPMRFTISALRLAYDDRPILNVGPVLGWLARMGEPLYGRQTPDGYPLDASSWNSASQMAVRFDVAKAIGSSSAGLFRSEGAPSQDQPGFPQLANPLYYDWLESTLSHSTREALAQATSAQEWSMFLLSSPEFMSR